MSPQTVNSTSSKATVMGFLWESQLECNIGFDRGCLETSNYPVIIVRQWILLLTAVCAGRERLLNNDFAVKWSLKFEGLFVLVKYRFSLP